MSPVRRSIRADRIFPPCAPAARSREEERKHFSRLANERSESALSCTPTPPERREARSGCGAEGESFVQAAYRRPFFAQNSRVPHAYPPKLARSPLARTSEIPGHPIRISRWLAGIEIARAVLRWASDTGAPPAVCGRQPQEIRRHPVEGLETKQRRDDAKACREARPAATQAAFTASRLHPAS